jgi:DHA2 family multidrug resistance protein
MAIRNSGAKHGGLRRNRPQAASSRAGRRGVHREKNNQVSGLPNFARNLGGSIGTSLLTVFLARQNQVHQVNFAAYTSHGDPNFEQWLKGLKAVFMSQGCDTVRAAQKALALAYQTV